MLPAHMLRTILGLSLLLVACDGDPAPAKPAAEAAKQVEPVKPAEPVVPPAPVARPKPAFMSEPERLNPEGKPFADHERRTIDVAGLARRGGEKAKLVIMGCIDMRDPFVKRGQRNLAEIFAVFPEDVALYIRPYWNMLESAELMVKKGKPDSIAMRDLTQLLARALVAAEQQGKIWEMHDRLLAAEKDQLTREGLARMAVDAGLDGEKWKAALDSKATEEAVAAHKQACNALGVDRGVPVYFLNGRLSQGSIKLEDLRYLVELELAGGFEALPKPPPAP